MKKKIRIFVILVLLSFLFCAGFLIVVYYGVSREAADRISRGVIEKVIFSESPVYYDDGKTVIGVFFEKTHRKYIHYKDIPPYFIKAIIASEDKNFFQHPGFDTKAIFRAMLANLRAGRVVQGGSTLTQQTAKNVFERQRRSFKAKLKELMQALLLEREYSKEEILEMYINQFFVTGFGRGLEIAAQYFFDKNAGDLDLVECAFIAGSVKSPNNYNPFTKKTESMKSKILKRAKRRKDYVLSNMLRLRFITEDEYKAAIDREVPFKEGTVTYRLNVILDYVREQLESDYFRLMLEEQGVDNIATSGIRIYTSINKDIQEGALKSIRYHLPFMDVQLRGYNRSEIQEKYNLLKDTTLRRKNSDLPFLCRITHVERNKRNPQILVAWENGGGIVEYKGLKALGEAWLKGTYGKWEAFGKEHVNAFLKNFQENDLVAVRAMEDEESGEQKSWMITAFPELEGGTIVIKGGMIKAMVGGFQDRFFNRAADAKRQLGSIFKPLVYTAALQLKWNSLDALSNKRDLFVFENTHYLPKPDHKPQSDRVSMLWAGTKSENLATVWLLYHLTDHLNRSEFNHIARGVGLSRGPMETYEDYVRRIRDRHGIVVTRENLMEAAFERARKEAVTDLIFGGQEDVLASLNLLHFDIDPTKLDLQNPEEFQIYRHSFKRLQLLNAEMLSGFDRIREQHLHGDINGNHEAAETEMGACRGYYVSEEANGIFKIIYSQVPYSTDEGTFYPMTPQWLSKHIREIDPGNIWLDNLMTSKAIEILQAQIKEKFMQFLAKKRYDPEVLYYIRDFRTLVNLFYVVRLGKALGIATSLDPVLSFPLGANAVSIADAALAYHSIMTGQISSFPPGSDAAVMIPVITKIEDRNGEVLWNYQPQPKRVLSKRVSGMVSEILRMVMEKGTGHSAKDAIQLELDLGEGTVKIPLISFGKTGTANRFTNSSFVGFVPGPDSRTGALDLEEGYVAASYVGYDDNRPMKGKHVRIYGASGALPLWIDTMNAIANSTNYKTNLQVADLAFTDNQIPPYLYQSFRQVTVSPKTGLLLEADDQPKSDSPLRTFADLQSDDPDTRRFKRTFEPLNGDHNEATPNN